MRKKWNISCLVIGFFLFVIVSSLHKGLGNYCFAALGNFMIWLAMPTLVENILELFQSSNNGLWESYWRMNGASGIINCFSFVVIGLGLIVLSLAF